MATYRAICITEKKILGAFSSQSAAQSAADRHHASTNPPHVTDVEMPMAADYLMNDIITPSKIHIGKLASSIKIPKPDLQKILTGNGKITPTIANRIGKALNVRPHTILKKQAEHELFIAKKNDKHLASIKKLR